VEKKTKKTTPRSKSATNGRKGKPLLLTTLGSKKKAAKSVHVEKIRKGNG